MGIYTPGPRKYPQTSTLLASSAGLGWPSISVQLLSHCPCEVPAVVLPSVEICIVVAGTEHGLVRRNATGFYQEATARTGAIWLSPAGLSKEIEITSPIPETAHLLLTAGLFDRLKDDFRLPEKPAYSIRNEAGITDNVIETLGRSILYELTVETAATRLYVETASLALAGRLVQKYNDSWTRRVQKQSASYLDSVRLRRVFDFIEANITNEITLDDLARVAGYSPYHFARKFTVTVGVAPHRYVSQIRLEIAMAELAAGKLPLAQIALNAHFSSQATFTRAFHRAAGMTPLEYRRHRN